MWKNYHWCGTKFPQAFIHVTMVINFPLSNDVRVSTCFFPLTLIILDCLYWTVIPVSSTLYTLYDEYLIFCISGSYMSKNELTASGLNPFILAAEVACGVLMDNSGCLCKNARSYFLRANSLLTLKGCLRLFEMAN